MSMERDPQNPQPPFPGGRALERLRQFEAERGLEPSHVHPAADDENGPSGGGAPEEGRGPGETPPEEAGAGG